MNPAALPWCLRCPKGHSSLRGHGGDSYECETCSRTFSGKPIDARSVDGFPVDIEEIEEDVIP